MATKSKKLKTSLNPFYGYPAEVIADWCGVSAGTAEHWKSGRRRPSRSALRLFRLYRDGKVLDEAWKDYRVVKGVLFGLDGRPIRPSHVVLFGLVWQALADKDPDCYLALLQKAGEQ